MSGHAARDYWEDWGLVLLVASFLIGPATAALDLLIGYAAVKPACRNDTAAALRLLSFVAFGVTLIGAGIGYRCLTRLRGAVDDGGRIVDRSYFAARRHP